MASTDRGLSESEQKSAPPHGVINTEASSCVDARANVRVKSDLDGALLMRALARRRPRAPRGAPPAEPHAGSVDIGQSPAARWSDGPDEDHRVRARGAMTTSARVERLSSSSSKVQKLERLALGEDSPSPRHLSPHPRRFWGCTSDWSRALIQHLRCAKRVVIAGRSETLPAYLC